MAASDAGVSVDSASLKFVLGSYRVFDELQSNVISAETPSSLLAATCAASHEYKMQIEVYSQDISSILLAAEAMDSADAILAFLRTEIDMAESTFKLWSLCDICLLNQRLTSEIFNWLQLSTLEINVAQYVEFFSKLEFPESSASEGDRLGFYGLVEQLVLQGRLRDAWKILSLHSDMRNSTESSSYVDLQSLFFSHPYSSLLADSADDTDEEQSDDLPYAASTDHWRARVSAIRASQRLLLDEDAGLVFDLLEGDALSPRLGAAYHSWEECALALLLYAVPAPLTHNSILKAFNEAMSCFDADSHAAMQSSIIRSIILGEPGPPIRYMSEQASALTERGYGGASALSLLSTAHMAQLLHLHLAGDAGEGGLELGILWPQNQASLVEELFLQAAERLDLLEAPIGTVVGYCMACPLRGVQFAQTFVSRRPVSSDEDALSMSELLTSLDLTVSARVLLSTRGTWWLKTCRNACKALLFFSMSADTSRAAALLEGALYDVVAAVTACGALGFGVFSSLQIHPLFDAKSALGSCSVSPETTEEQATAAVLAALNRTESILSVFESSASLVKYDKELFLSETSALAHALLCYSTCIRLAAEGAVDGRILVPLQSLADAISNRQIPLRYCVHLIELIAWMDKRADVGKNKCTLTQGQVEGVAIIFFRATTSAHAQVYTGGASASTEQSINGSLVDMLARAVLEANAVKRAKPGGGGAIAKPPSLMSLITAS